MTDSFRSPERLARHAELIQAWQTTRSARALEALVADYQPLFRAEIGRALRGRTLTSDHQADLMQECIKTLIGALDGYKPDICASIAPYLSRHIKGVVRRYVLDFRSACRLGTSSDDRKAYYAAQRLRVDRLQAGQDGLLDHDIEAVARDSATSRTVAARAVAAMSSGSVALDEVETELADPLGDGAHILAEKDALLKAMSAFERHVATLPERTRTIVCETMLGHKVEGAVARLAERYDLTPRRVRQIQSEGLMALRALMENDSITRETIF
jgi:RNA polymerase sigma factor (sigma-70 family)